MKQQQTRRNSLLWLWLRFCVSVWLNGQLRFEFACVCLFVPMGVFMCAIKIAFNNWGYKFQYNICCIMVLSRGIDYVTSIVTVEWLRRRSDKTTSLQCFKRLMKICDKNFEIIITLKCNNKDPNKFNIATQIHKFVRNSQ